VSLLDREDFEPVVGVSLRKVRQVPRRNLAIRFGFGAGISTVASLIAIAFGARAGGLMLAFPAILPATLTLLEQEESTRKAADDDLGSVLGALGLAAFAAVAWWLLPRAGGAPGLAAAGVAWLATATGCYFLVRAMVLRRVARRGARRPRGGRG
jgi:apolipoprotein N-acyltransferase